MVVSMALLVVGIVVEWLHDGVPEQLLVVTGMIGLIVSALMARGVTWRKIVSDAKRDVKEIKGAISDLIEWLLKVLGGLIWYVVLPLLLLWGIVALIKFFWIHS